MANTSSVRIHELNDLWAESTGDPLTLFETDNPLVQAGSYAIEPGERIPATGTTSHGGPELSIIISGEVVLGLPNEGYEYTVRPETLVTIPTGVEHYSMNRTNDRVELVYVIVGEL